MQAHNARLCVLLARQFDVALRETLEQIGATALQLFRALALQARKLGRRALDPALERFDSNHAIGQALVLHNERLERGVRARRHGRLDELAVRVLALAAKESPRLSRDLRAECTGALGTLRERTVESRSRARQLR